MSAPQLALTTSKKLNENDPVGRTRLALREVTSLADELMRLHRLRPERVERARELLLPPPPGPKARQ